MAATIWVFNGVNSRFASGVFDQLDQATDWISENKLSGTLTEYPINTGVYDWAIENEFFAPKKQEHTSPEFIGKFSSASQAHFHFENGKQN
ncbi:DUF7710 domain-containing protein [Chitinophaga sp.]|uniref:DUF7710 domain-containing protein n=1 Tax=Chitinophaga sp. TaxID=1869181 RepID=UPI002F938087